MIQITPQMRILLAVEAVDFRKGIDGLARSCREAVKGDPFSGHVFVFPNKGGTSIKVLMYDGQGLWLCQKRLSKGRFRWWPQGSTQGVKKLLAHELHLLIWNGNPSGGEVSPVWRRFASGGG